jgi:hypothetical protein
VKDKIGKNFESSGHDTIVVTQNVSAGTYQVHNKPKSYQPAHFEFS